MITTSATSNKEDCSLSKKTAHGFEEMGYHNVVRVPAGIDGWKEAGHETVAGKLQERYGIAKDEAEKRVDSW